MDKNKIENLTENSEIVAFLRLLADSLEKDEEKLPDYQLPLKGFNKMKLSIKKKGTGYKLKLKINLPGEEEDNEEDYSSLKKRMKIYFREMKKALDRNSLPSSEIISIFLEDSRKMIQHTGEDMGEEFYPAYSDACEALEQAYAKKDMPGITAAYNALEEQKKICHDKFK
ncbi:MAG: GAK system XXXCH domain-containing protein [Thermodesulfobacteriota bacterium]